MEWFGLVHHIRAKEGSDFGLAGLGSGRFGLLRGEFFFSSSYHERNECVDGLIFFSFLTSRVWKGEFGVFKGS